MPVWSHSVYALGAALHAVEAGWRLRRAASVAEVQQRTWRQLAGCLGRTRFWSNLGLTPDTTLARFRERVPLQTHADLAPAIARMQQGEPDVLWPGHCRRYAQTAGLATGSPRTLPVTEKLRTHFQRSAFDALALHRIRAGHRGICRGRHLLCGSQARLPAPDAPGGTAPTADAGPGDSAPLTLPGAIASYYCSPGPALERIAEWDHRLATLAEPAPTSDVTLIGGLPHGLIQLARTHAERAPDGGPPAPRPHKSWPRLECLVLGGIPPGPFADELRSLFGPKVQLHEIYAATEAFIAAQDSAPGQGLRVLADRGVYFEFLPLSELDTAPLAQLGPKTVPLEGVETGPDYAVVLTTPGGLARYVLGDVVRFVSRQPARLLYVGRTSFHLRAAGENISESDLTDTLTRLCRRRGWNTVNFHVAPSAGGPPRHEWWIELRPGTMETPRGPTMALELDADLQRTNRAYARARQTGALDQPVVRLVMPGVFEQWLRAEEKWHGPQKFARCRPDRRIADALAAITQFAND